MINIEHLKCVNTQLFAESVKLGPVFSDFNSAGAMKDEYAVLLFSWFSFVESLRNCRYIYGSFTFTFTFAFTLTKTLHKPLLTNFNVFGSKSYNGKSIIFFYNELLR